MKGGMIQKAVNHNQAHKRTWQDCAHGPLYHIILWQLWNTAEVVYFTINSILCTIETLAIQFLIGSKTYSYLLYLSLAEIDSKTKTFTVIAKFNAAGLAMQIPFPAPLYINDTRQKHHKFSGVLRVSSD